MQTVFIDCGAHRGRILERFISKHPDTEAYAFECNPFFKDQKYRNGVIASRSALWINDKGIDLYVNKNVPQVEGSSCFGDKITGGLDSKHPVHVESIDIDRWLKKTFAGRRVCIHMKMNIEGAEYPVLEHMILNGSISMIRFIYIQWHWRKIPSISESWHNSIVSKLSEVKSLTVHNGYGAI
jgi:FkbM family methyltransferase